MFLGVLSVAGLWQCAHESTPPPEYPPLDQSQTASLEPHTSSSAKETHAAPLPQVTVKAKDHTPIQGPSPTLRIVAPRNNAMVRTDKVTVRFALKHWELSPTGNHVHLIVDNHPYIALRDVSKPIEDLGKLMQQELGVELSEGTHLLRSFPSRGHHESVKEEHAFAWTLFHYKKKTDGSAFDGKAPLLTYSRPKGCNKVADPLLLDFYLTNVPALSAQGFHVRYTFDNSVTGTLTEWKPFYVHNLSEGTHQIRLELLDAKDVLVPGPYNDTSRTFQMAATCP